MRIIQPGVVRCSKIMSNPFYSSSASNRVEEDDDDYDTRRNQPRREKLSYEEQLLRLQQEKDDSEQRQLDSTRRTLAIIDESERMNSASRPQPGQRFRTDDGRGGSRNPQGRTQNVQNIDMMIDGLSRMKGLAQGLCDKIQSQNEQLDRTGTATDRADKKLKDQNRQIRKILR